MISVIVQIDRSAALPVRAQIAEAYAQAILDGRLPPGAALQATVISPHARLWIKRLMPGPATTHETP